MLLTPEPDAQADAALARARAREIGLRLAVRPPRVTRGGRRGFGELATLPLRDRAEEIDLDASLEHLLASRPPAAADIRVRERRQLRRSLVFAVDVSGSMKGERALTAAAVVGALAAELSRDRLAVIAFWSDAALLLRLGDPVAPGRLIDALLGLPARGLTNVAFPIEVAARELAAVSPSERRVLLLSDCLHNAGPDPRPLAARLPRLDVLLDVTGEHDGALARELATAGGGRLLPMRGHRDAAPALTRALAP